MNVYRDKKLVILTTAASAVVLLSAGAASAASSASAGHAAVVSPSPHGSTATHKKPKPKPPRPKPGLFITGADRVTRAVRPSAYLLDGNNEEHFITLVPNANHPHKDTVEYYTRAQGKTHWTIHHAPTLISAAGAPRIEEHLNPYSSDLDVVIYACDNIFAAEVSPTATRLPQFTTVAAENTCSAKVSAKPAPSMSGDFYSDTDGQVLGALVPDQNTSGTWDLLTGTPGSDFTKLIAVPTADSFVPTQLTPDSQEEDSDPYVIGYGVDQSGDEGVFATSLKWEYDSGTSTYVPSWNDLQEIATLGNTKTDYVIDSAVKYDQIVDVGLYKAPGSAPGQKHTLYTDETDSTNQWSSPIALPHTTLDDNRLLLVRNTITGTLHATYQRTISAPTSARRDKSGILQELIKQSTWSTPTFLTNWYKDRPLQASVTSNGRLVVEYRQS